MQHLRLREPWPKETETVVRVFTLGQASANRCAYPSPIFSCSFFFCLPPLSQIDKQMRRHFEPISRKWSSPCVGDMIDRRAEKLEKQNKKMFNKQEVAVLIFLIKSKKVDSNQTTRRQKSLLGNPSPTKRWWRRNEKWRAGDQLFPTSKTFEWQFRQGAPG